MVKHATLADVAAEAGLSLATVSRALNGSSRRVSPENYQRVRTAADKLGYSVNISAQAIARGSLGVISMLVVDIGDPYFAAIARGVFQACDTAGLAVSIAMTQRDPDREARAIRAIAGQRPRGVIIASSRSQESKKTTDADLQRLIESGIEVVSLAEPIDKIAHIPSDHERGAAALARSLARTGYRTAMIVAAEEGTYASDRRVAGFSRAFEAAGGVVERIEYGGYTTDSGAKAAETMLAEGISPHTVLFAVTDMIALGVARAIRAAGRIVGEDIAVAGFGDITICQDVTPQLTTVAVDLEDSGRRAVAAILNSEKHPAYQPIAARPVMRGSTPPVL